jgi:FKBP-type peptidyl-prolyl cis-trans isomerase
MMMRSYILFVVASSVTIIGVNGWSHPSRSVPHPQQQQHDWNIPTPSTRRDVLSKVAGVALVASTMASKPTIAAAAAASPEVFNTANGIKYAIIKKGTGKGSPIDKDIVAIEYTGYLTDGTIFGTSCHYDIGSDTRLSI